MAQKLQIFEEGYGKGWLYKELEFIDFVYYHYQVFQSVSTTSLRTGKRTIPKYRLSGNLKFVNFSDTVVNGWFLLLVTKKKGFKIHLEPKDELLKTFYFNVEQGGEVA
jgi:hypothetical protein